MKSLFERFINKEPQFNYTIADYHPARANKHRKNVAMTEYELDLVAEKDDMDIDRIYQIS